MHLSRYLLLGILASTLLLSAHPAAAADSNDTQQMSDITDLISITLEWTAPGDDSLSGTAWQYDLRWSLTPISALSFLSANPVFEVPRPSLAGTTQRVTVSLPQLPAIYFALRTCDERGNWSPLSNVVVSRPAGTTGIGDPALVVQFAPPTPNPARGSTRFAFTLPTRAPIEVVAFDIQGRKVRTLMREERAAGPAELSWDLTDDSGTRLPGGVYFVRARLGSTIFDRRVVVAR